MNKKWPPILFWRGKRFFKSLKSTSFHFQNNKDCMLCLHWYRSNKCFTHNQDLLRYFVSKDPFFLVIYLPIWLYCLCRQWVIFRCCNAEIICSSITKRHLSYHIFISWFLWKMQSFSRAQFFSRSCLPRWCTFNEIHEFSQCVTCLSWTTATALFSDCSGTC